MSNIKDLTGQRFGNLVVIEKQGRSRSGAIIWRCICDCGQYVAIRGDNLRNGSSKSCGCSKRHGHSQTLARRGRKQTHGRTRENGRKTPEYSAWINMRHRCNNSNDPNYSYYGGRGIKICDRWLCFENFFADMGLKPGKWYDIDRINVNGNYEPENCRWATRQQNSRNRRIHKNNTTGFKGVRHKKGSNKFTAYIKFDNKYVFLGSYTILKDAAIAYDKAASFYFGEFAATNKSLGLLN